MAGDDGRPRPRFDGNDDDGESVRPINPTSAGEDPEEHPVAGSAAPGASVDPPRGEGAGPSPAATPRVLGGDGPITASVPIVGPQQSFELPPYTRPPTGPVPAVVADQSDPAMQAQNEGPRWRATGSDFDDAALDDLVGVEPEPSSEHRVSIRDLRPDTGRAEGSEGSGGAPSAKREGEREPNDRPRRIGSTVPVSEDLRPGWMATGERRALRDFDPEATKGSRELALGEPSDWDGEEELGAVDTVLGPRSADGVTRGTARPGQRGSNRGSTRPARVSPVVPLRVAAESGTCGSPWVSVSRWRPSAWCVSSWVAHGPSGS
ncbi:MAG: hypothetical protein R2698_13045 [Microthrixaceae bacterium]